MGPALAGGGSGFVWALGVGGRRFQQSEQPVASAVISTCGDSAVGARPLRGMVISTVVILP